MRVLVSSGWHGGAGGSERALYSVLRALEADQVDVVVRRQLGGPLSVSGPHVRVQALNALRWKGSAIAAGTKPRHRLAVNGVRRRLMPRYDIYLQYYSGPNVVSAVRADLTLLIPAGNEVSSEQARSFDLIALEAPDNAGLAPKDVPTILLPPPLFPLSATLVSPATELPERFFLTVFNPYKPSKGADRLERAADSAPHPIVWCHSRQTISHAIPPGLVRHPRIIHVSDPSPSELRYLYERCLAYLSFSRREGFGWAVADALRYSPIVVSESIGVLSYPGATLEGVLPMDDGEPYFWGQIERSVPVPAGSRDLEWISPVRFRGRLSGLSQMGVDAGRSSG